MKPPVLMYYRDTGPQIPALERSFLVLGTRLPANSDTRATVSAGVWTSVVTGANVRSQVRPVRDAMMERFR